MECGHHLPYGCSLFIDASQADAIRVKVGFPLSPDTLNPRSLHNYYYLVKVQETAFFENVLSAR